MALINRPLNPEQWMKLALEEARRALEHEDVPIGAVIVRGDSLLASGHNRKEINRDSTAHAEMEAIKAACAKAETPYLEGAYLFVTLEPCPMCTGALLLTKLQGVYYGVEDPKMGALTSLYQLGEDRRLNHQLEVYAGILKDECSEILKEFFKVKR